MCDNNNNNSDNNNNNSDNNNNNSDNNIEIVLYDENDIETLNIIKKLFRDYFKELALDWSWQSIDDELNLLPGKYGSDQDGFILIAKYKKEEIVGCIALRKIDTNVGEIKRLYVCPNYRRQYGIASKLLDALLIKAKSMNYKELKLDTLKRLKAANFLYNKFNFVPIPQYCANPLHDALFFGLKL